MTRPGTSRVRSQSLPGAGHGPGRERRHEQTGAGSSKEMGGGDRGRHMLLEQRRLFRKGNIIQLCIFLRNEVCAHFLLVGKCRLHRDALCSSTSEFVSVLSSFLLSPEGGACRSLTGACAASTKAGSLLFFDFCLLFVFQGHRFSNMKLLTVFIQIPFCFPRD